MPLYSATNSARWSADEAPKSWADLLDPKFKGEIGIQQAGAGAMSWNVILFQRKVLGDDYWAKLAANEPRLYSSMSPLSDDLARGELTVGAVTVGLIRNLVRERLATGGIRHLPQRRCRPHMTKPAQMPGNWRILRHRRVCRIQDEELTMVAIRTKLIGLAVVLASAGAGAFVLTSGDKPIVELAASNNVIKVEAAAVNFAGWPEMRISVNGEQIGLLAIENKQRDMYEFDVPNSLGDVSKIEIQLTNETDCAGALRHSFQSCTDRALVLRKVFLNDKQLEGGEATGEGNSVYSLRRSDGGVNWQIES